MAAIDRLLSDASWTVADLEGLAVAVGPGSFTGLRVGLSTVKGLALALSIPVAAVPTLDAMAAMLPFAALPVCPVLDAVSVRCTRRSIDGMATGCAASGSTWLSLPTTSLGDWTSR